MVNLTRKLTETKSNITVYWTNAYKNRIASLYVINEKSWETFIVIVKKACVHDVTNQYRLLSNAITKKLWSENDKICLLTIWQSNIQGEGEITTLIRMKLTKYNKSFVKNNTNPAVWKSFHKNKFQYEFLRFSLLNKQ